MNVFVNDTIRRQILRHHSLRLHHVPRSRSAPRFMIDSTVHYLLLERSLSVDCMTGPWGPWSPCTRNGQNCGYRYGMISRTREVLESPSPNGVRCPSLVETRCCLMEMRRCVGKALRLFFCLITVLYLSHYVRTYLY